MATVLISLDRLQEYDVAIKNVISTADATKYQSITYNDSTRVLSFFKTAATTGTPDFTLTLPDPGLKVDKLSNATAGNIVKFGEAGAVADSGIAIGDVALSADLEDVATSGAAADVSIADAAENFTATDVEGALAELFQDIANNETHDAVTVEKLTTPETGFLATYVVKQNNVQVGASINIPKDFVIKSATVGTCSVADSPVTGFAVGDKYIDLEVNVAEGSAQSTHLYLKASDLAPVYYGDSASTEITTAVAADGKITAAVVAINGSKLTDGTVTKAKLTSAVQASLDLADSAVQDADLSAVAFAGANTASNLTVADSAGHFTSNDKTVENVLAEIGTALGSGGSVATQIATEIGKLDSSVAADDGYALTGVTEVDGKLTAKTQVQFLKAADYSIAAAADITAMFS